MSEISLPSDFVLGLLNEVSRQRALADHETDVVERIVCRGHRSTGMRQQWTGAMDRQLLRAAELRGGVKRFAYRHHITPNAAYRRLDKLRKGKATLEAAKGRD